MSGHSKWATIKRKKGAADAARGAKFSKLIKEITVAAKLGGGDVNGNARLRSAVAAARAANMPNSNIDRAISRGAGGEDGMVLEEILYEAYGPGGTALLIQITTDNRNRTASEVRHLVQKRGATIGEPGSVAWKFTKKGQMYVEREDGMDEDSVMMAALDAGAEDVRGDGEAWEILTDPTALYEVRDALEKAGFKPTEVRQAMIPNVTVPLSGDKAESLLRLVEALDEHDDVQSVFGDYEIDDAELERIGA